MAIVLVTPVITAPSNAIRNNLMLTEMELAMYVTQHLDAEDALVSSVNNLVAHRGQLNE
jgi:hypothetical protein